MPERMIEARVTKCLLLLTETELLSLLAHDKEIWTRAIKRGKTELRTRATERRQNDEQCGQR